MPSIVRWNRFCAMCYRASLRDVSSVLPPLPPSSMSCTISRAAFVCFGCFCGRHYNDLSIYLSVLLSCFAQRSASVRAIPSTVEFVKQS